MVANSNAVSVTGNIT